MSRPTQPPPPTPGPIRVHRPSFLNIMPSTPSMDGRFHPYHNAGSRGGTPAPLRSVASTRDENCPPNSGTSLFSPSPFLSTSQHADPPRVGSGLRRWASTSTNGDFFSNGVDDSTFGDEPRSMQVPTLSKADRILDQYNLWDQKDQVYHFVELPAHDRELVIFANLLKLRSELDSQTQTFDQFRTQVFELKKYVSGNWALSKAQEELLSQLLGHWLIKPLHTYDKIYDRVKTFIHLRAEWLHLGVYVTDPVARTVVDKYLKKIAADMKGTFRKEIMASIKDSKALDTFARAMIEKYHCPVRPNEPPRDILATLAFLRSLAAEFQSTAPNDSTVPTKYWRRVEAELADLYEKNGEERDSDARWKLWEDKVIDEDQAKYRGSAPGMCTADATSREALAESGSNQQPSSTSSPADAAGPSTDTRMDAAPMFSLYGASAVPVDIPAYAMDSNVDLRTLGDIAGAIEKNL